MVTNADWLGLTRVEDRTWSLPVTTAVMSGASALFGGCATAAGLAVADELTELPVVWASAHFGAMAKVGTTVNLRARTISAGRTMSHLEVLGEVDGREAFMLRAAAGARPAGDAEGQWVDAPTVATVEAAAPFDHPVHAGTWAERFEWRLAGRGEEARAPWAAWWVRPVGDRPGIEVLAPVLVDYVTYGVGRALGVAMGGLSVDNGLRLHRRVDAEWFLLVIAPDAIDGGFGHGTARLFADDVLVATGTQSIVVNTWDWRLPDERDD